MVIAVWRKFSFGFRIIEIGVPIMWRSCCSGVVEIVVVAHGMAEVVVGLEMVGVRFASSCNSCLDYVGLVVACLCSLFCFDTSLFG